ncbi:MAG: penicillin-binding protein 2 [Candidatus Melainabacteria bacterium]|nr:penicillin-binding protein 2 [Candidatus Melainabacteria bacterium]
MYLSYKLRVFVCQAVLILVFILIWLQLFNIQIIKSGGFVLEAKKQFYKQLISLRGDIRDRNGDLLALDIITYDLYNNVRNLNKISEESIDRLSKLLNISPSNLKVKLGQKKDTRMLSGISEKTANRIRKINPGFAYLIPVVKRSYPHKKMASHLIGFVNSDHKGQHGVEYKHQDLLTKISDKSSKTELFPKGTDIVLSIDSQLQEYCEEELNKAARKSNAARGAIIVLSPKTGEIYAWAVYPNYDPNIYYKEKVLKNWSITDIYQPGSTFKILTISSALENMTIEKTSTFYDPGFLKVGKRIVRNHAKNKPQQINLLELFKQSSNVASAQVGLSMKPETFYNSMKKIMIGQKTNIDLPGESEGLLLDSSKWRTIDLATTAFGQGAVSVTPIQLSCAISAIANHGLWFQPHVLKGTWDPAYMLINKSPNQIYSEQVISEETADYVSGLLKQSVKENLKAMAYIAGDVPGYEVAGKTGTAQKIRPDGKGYWGGHTVASFIGYLPADDPGILALVVIDDPKTGGGWGNTVCGPVFNNIAKMAAKRFLGTHNSMKKKYESKE